jgi:TamB, inner membrane protein subunit of TAM complex
MLHNIFRFLRASMVGLILLVVLALWGLRSNWAQNKLTPLAEELLSDALGAPVEVGTVDFDLPAHVVLSDLKMQDAQRQTIFALKQLKLGFASFSLMKFVLAPRDVQAIKVNHVMLVEPEAHLYRSRADSAWNYGFLSGSADTDTTPSKPLALQLSFPAIELRGGRFSMVDSTRADTALASSDRLNFNNLDLHQITADLGFHYTPDQRMYGHVRGLSLEELHSKQFIHALSTDYLIKLKPDPPSKLTFCFENTHIRIGRTQLDLDGELEDIRPDSGHTGFFPVFSAHIRPSRFDFQTLNKLIPNDLPIQEPLQLAGYLYGDLNGIYSDSLEIGLMEHTRLLTTVALTHYIEEDALRFKLDVKRGTLSFEELQALLPESQVPLHGIVRLRGPISGSLAQIKAPLLDVEYLDHTRLHLDARLTDYTQGDDILMDIKFKDSKFSFVEIHKLLPDMNLPPWLGRFGTCGIDGKFLGGINDFVVNTVLTTDYGNVSSNLHLTLPPKVKELAYDGWVSTQNLNFVALEADLPFRSRYLNFEGKITGNGTTWGQMIADVDGKLTDSDIEGHHIDAVTTKDVKLRGYHISGEIDVADREGNASVTVDIDVPDSAQHYAVVGDVERLDLAHYEVLPDDSVYLSAIVNIDVEGKELEDYTGKMRFLQASLLRRKSADSLEMKNIVLTVKRDAQNRHLVKLRSSIADMDLIGDFKYQKSALVIGSLAREARMYLKNKDSITTAYYAQKVIEPEAMSFKDTLRTKAELNHVLSFFQLPLYLRPGTELRLSYLHGAADELELEIASDSVGYSTIGLLSDSIFVTITKEGSQNLFVGQAFVMIHELSVTKDLHFQNVSFEPTADEDGVDYFFRASQDDIGSFYIISAQTVFKDGGEIESTIRQGESVISIRKQEWRFSKGNSINHYYEKPPSLAKVATDSVISRYHIRGLQLLSGDQEINIGGVVSRDKKDLLNVDIRNLDIQSVMSLLDNTSDVGGTLKRATFGTWNLLSGQPSIYGSGEVVNFRYHEVDSIGMRFYAGWPFIYGPSYAGLRVEVGHWGQDSIITKGWYNVANDSLHFDADSSSLQLSWIEPFVEGTLSDMKGHVALDGFKVRGTAAKPELEGIARFTNTSFKVDYFNNPFRIGDGQLNFDNERINISHIMLHDTARGSAELNGVVWYNDARGVRLDMRVDKVRNLILMDTRKQDNDLFYGHLVLDGDSAKISGNLLTPAIEAWVNTGDGTWLDIPISDYTSANRLDFVNFIQKGDTLAKTENMDFGGMTMSLTVHASENARVRLIFDEFAGDIIEAWGEGSLNIELTEAGEFNMFGAYTVGRGDYHFTMENVLNKKFVVNPGGRIVWNGDPFDAQVDLDAIYKVSADISSIVGGNSGGSRVPVEIVMRMKGSLLTPEISLSLQLDQLSSQDVLGLGSYFSGIQYDEQELNKQVVSLLMFRRFTANSSYFASSGSAANVTSSISELVSNQVNHWLSQAFADPKLGVEINSNEFQDVQLALRASLFNDRVTVERNGNLIGNSTGNLSIGDLNVLIKVLPRADTTGMLDPHAGQLVMEIFNREDFSITSTNNVSRGTGIFYKKDFDRLAEVFDAQRGHARREEKVE